MSLNSEILQLAETLEAIRFLTNTPGGGRTSYSPENPRDTCNPE